MENLAKWTAVNRLVKLFAVLTIGLLVASCNGSGPGAQATQNTFLPGLASQATSPSIASPGTPPPITVTGGSTPSAPAGDPTSTAVVSGPPSPQANQAQDASALPDPNSYQWVPVANGLDSPVGLANAGDGSGRLFILERAGRIRLWKDGQLQASSYLDITSQVGSQGSEQGLLGIVFDPKFKQNGYFYINYTDLNGNTVIARYQADPSANQADPAKQVPILNVRQPFQNHNGGGMLFGPDGYLYLGLGDGGSQGDPNGNGQSLDTLLGKILRIDVNGTIPYSIPKDNPFIGKGQSEIWAYGLRNPWRFDFDPLTHDLYIGDVGQDSWEEIDYLPAGSPAGANFGWNYLEGTHLFRGNPPQGVSLINPVFEYSHSDGCSVTGGVIYRGQALPAWHGVYLFADYCSGNVWGLLRHPGAAWEGKILFQTSFAVTSFGRDEQGEVYLVDQHGTLNKLAAK